MEFVLLLPMIVILLLGLAAFGFALADWIDETQLSSQAVRWAAVDSEHGTGTEIKPATFLKWVTEQADDNNVREAKATMCSPASKQGEYVEVKLTYNYKWFGLGSFIGTHVETPLESKAFMRIEQAPIEPYPTTC